MSLTTHVNEGILHCSTCSWNTWIAFPRSSKQYRTSSNTVFYSACWFSNILPQAFHARRDTQQSDDLVNLWTWIVYKKTKLSTYVPTPLHHPEPDIVQCVADSNLQSISLHHVTILCPFPLSFSIHVITSVCLYFSSLQETLFSNVYPAFMCTPFSSVYLTLTFCLLGKSHHFSFISLVTSFSLTLISCLC